MSSKYIKSDYTDSLISPVQSLAEKICVKFAKLKGIDLPYKFWEDKKWGKRFVAQAKHAATLLKDYDYEIIIAALNDRECRNLESLGARAWIVPVCEEIKKKRESHVEINSPILIEVDINEKPRPSVGKKTLFSKLKDL
jgi:hypothetical protein